MYFGCKLRYSKFKNFNPEESLPPFRQCKSSSKRQLYLPRRDTTCHIWTLLNVIKSQESSWPILFVCWQECKKKKKISAPPSLLCLFLQRSWWPPNPTPESTDFTHSLCYVFPPSTTQRSSRQYMWFNVYRCPYLRKWWIQAIHMPLYNTRLW